jgi:hypothetical protein
MKHNMISDLRHITLTLQRGKVQGPCKARCSKSKGAAKIAAGVTALTGAKPDAFTSAVRLAILLVRNRCTVAILIAYGKRRPARTKVRLAANVNTLVGIALRGTIRYYVHEGGREGRDNSICGGEDQDGKESDGRVHCQCVSQNLN